MVETTNEQYTAAIAIMVEWLDNSGHMDEFVYSLGIDEAKMYVTVVRNVLTMSEQEVAEAVETGVSQSVEAYERSV